MVIDPAKGYGAERKRWQEALLPIARPGGIGLSEEERGFSSCQLDSRHWSMRMRDGSVESVDGSGVVGKYPVRAPLLRCPRC